MLLLGWDLRLGVVAPGNYAPNQQASSEGRGKLCVHHIDGSIAAAEGVWSTPGLQRSSHLGNGLDGHRIQWLDTRHVAYAQCAGNWRGWTSMECASDPRAPDAPPTPAQIQTIAAAANALGVPPRLAQSMDDVGLAFHRSFPGPCAQWFGQTDCPGDGYVASADAIFAAMTGAPPEEDDVQITYITSQADPSVGIWAFDQLSARHVGGQEWGIIGYVNGGYPAVHALPPEMWDSIPKLLPTGMQATLTLKDLVNIQQMVKAIIPTGGGGGTTFTKLVGTIDLNARTIQLTPAA